MFCSVKTDEGNDGNASSLRSLTIHLHAPWVWVKFPSDPRSTF